MVYEEILEFNASEVWPQNEGSQGLYNADSFFTSLSQFVSLLLIMQGQDTMNNSSQEKTREQCFSK